MTNQWDAGTTPWLRQFQTAAGWGPEAKPVQCMFCGEQTVKRAASDRDEDTGRLELYCDNHLCDAREMVILVKRDGADAIFRADVKALHLIDDGSFDVHAAFPPEVKSYSMSDLLEDHGKEVERRMRKPPRVQD